MTGCFCSFVNSVCFCVVPCDYCIHAAATTTIYVYIDEGTSRCAGGRIAQVGKRPLETGAPVSPTDIAGRRRSYSIAVAAPRRRCCRYRVAERCDRSPPPLSLTTTRTAATAADSSNGSTRCMGVVGGKDGTDDGRRTYVVAPWCPPSPLYTSRE